MTTLQRAAGAALAATALAVLVLGANAPIVVHDGQRAMLRLAWSARPERIERCRQLSKEELERLPAHMRQPLDCEGVSARYRLTVRRDGMVAAERIVHGGGLRQDRRIYVFDELPLDPGDVAIEVTFDRVDDDEHPARRESDRDDERHDTDGRRTDGRDWHPGGETVPAHLVFTQRLRVTPREVILVTYSPERRALEGVRGDSSSLRRVTWMTTLIGRWLV